MVVCLICLYVAWWTGHLPGMYPASRPMAAGIGSSSSTLNWIKWVKKIDEWIYFKEISHNQVI